MAARLTALLPRLLALTVIWLLGAATLHARGRQPDANARTGGGRCSLRPKRPGSSSSRTFAAQAYVFAKGILQDAGFAWRVEGSVQGYAANTVAIQNPAPGTRVIDNGAPIVVLGLSQERCLRRARPAGEQLALRRDACRAGHRLEQEARRARLATTTAPAATTTEPAATTTEPAVTTTEPAATPTGPEPQQKNREPDFMVPGAPIEPADEMPLPAARTGSPSGVPRMCRSPLSRSSTSGSTSIRGSSTGARFGWYRRRRGPPHPHQGRPEPAAPLRLRRAKRSRRPPRARIRRERRRSDPAPAPR